MKTLICALTGILVALLVAPPALAEDESACAVASLLVHADYPLPHVAEAIAKGHLTIVVMGSASSMLPGAGEAEKAYPARLQAVLAERLPGVDVRVITHAKARETAAEMEQQLEEVVEREKPTLVIWQAGTVDAMRGIDPDAFSTTLGDGIETIKDADADALLVNMQYSPRTESVISLAAYVDVMRFVALQHEISLLDRLAIMKHWSELGTFDLYGPKKSMETAERVHDCIGRLLADLISEGVKLAEQDKTSSGDKSSESGTAPATENKAENKKDEQGNRGQ